MSCQTVRKSLSTYFDARVGEGIQNEVTRHLAVCRDCRAYADELARVGDLLRALPRVRVPDELTTRLRVVASHEQARRAARSDWRSVFRLWATDIKLLLDNLARPFALPVAGGLASALMLFTMLMPSLNFRHDFSNDIPLNFYTDATLVEMAPFDFTDEDIIVELAVDANGAVTGWSVLPRGALTREMTARIGNLILFTSFTPATLFGQPTASKVFVTLRRTAMVVRG